MCNTMLSISVSCILFNLRLYLFPGESSRATQCAGLCQAREEAPSVGEISQYVWAAEQKHNLLPSLFLCYSL